jgi:hypothetical protein
MINAKNHSPGVLLKMGENVRYFLVLCISEGILYTSYLKIATSLFDVLRCFLE